LAETSLALQILTKLNQTSQLNSTRILLFIQSCQHSSGGYTPNPQENFPDLSSTFFSLLGLTALNRIDLVNSTATANYLAQKQHLDPTSPSYYGGFSNLTFSKPNAFTTWQGLQSLSWLSHQEEINVTAATEWILGTLRNDSLFTMKYGSNVEYNIIEATSYQIASLSLLDNIDHINATKTAQQIASLQFDEGGFPGTPSQVNDDVPEILEVYSAIWAVSQIHLLSLLNIDTLNQWVRGVFEENGGAGALSDFQGTTLTTSLVIQGVASAGELGSIIPHWIDQSSTTGWLLTCLQHERASFSPTNSTILQSTIEFSPAQEGTYHMGLYHTASVLASLSNLGNLSLISANQKTVLLNEVVNCQITNPSINGYGGYSILNTSTFLVNPSFFADLETAYLALKILQLFNSTFAIANQSALTEFIMQTYKPSTGLFTDDILRGDFSKLRATRFAIECLQILNSTNLVNSTQTREAILPYLSSSDLLAVIDGIQVLRFLNGTNPTLLNTTSILSQMRQHQQQNGWITRFTNDTNPISNLLTTSECLALMGEMKLLDEWDSPLQLMPMITNFPNNITLGETIHVTAVLKSDLDDIVSNAHIQAQLITNTSLIYNSTTEVYTGSLVIPQNSNLLGPNELFLEADLVGFATGNLSIPVTISGNVNLTILEPPPSLAVAPEGVHIIVNIALEGGIPLGVTNIEITTNPPIPYSIFDLGQGEAQILFDLSGLNGSLNVEIKGIHNYCLSEIWNTTLQVVDDGIILLGNTTVQQIPVQEPVQWNCTASTYLNASLAGEKLIWTLYADSILLYQKNDTIVNPSDIFWMSTFNNTGSYTLFLSIPNKTNRRGATLEISFQVNKRILDFQISHSDYAYANETIFLNGVLQDSGNPLLDIIEIETLLSNGISNYSMRAFTQPGGTWSLEWVIPLDITHGSYQWTFTILNSSIYQFQYPPQTNITIYAQMLVNIDISQASASHGDTVTFTVHVTDLLLNAVDGIVFVELQGNPPGVVGITNTPFDLTIPAGIPWGWVNVDINISSELGGEIQKQLILWVGVSSEIEILEQPEFEISVIESTTFKLKINHPEGGFLRFYTLQFHVAIGGEIIATTSVESRLDGITEVQWTPPAVGLWNLTFEFNGKDQYSPTQLSILVNVTLVESQISLIHYSYTETPTSNQLTLEVQLTTSLGIPIPNASIVVSYNGTFVNGLTNAEGYISIPIDVGSLNGLLHITLEYKGDEKYAQSKGGPYPIPTRVVNHPPLEMTQTLLPASITTIVVSISLVFIRRRKQNQNIPQYHRIL
jgi:prenyltransferase beta subunit